MKKKRPKTATAREFSPGPDRGLRQLSQIVISDRSADDDFTARRPQSLHGIQCKTR